MQTLLTRHQLKSHNNPPPLLAAGPLLRDASTALAAQAAARDVAALLARALTCHAALLGPLQVGGQGAAASMLLLHFSAEPPFID